VTYQDFPPRRLEPETTHVVPAASAVGYLTTDSGYASTIKCAPRAYRFFTLHYLCDACPNEWQESSAVEGPSWCPCCEKETPAYLALECEEEAVTE